MNTTVNATFRIIAEERLGHWSARFLNLSQSASFRGVDCERAVRNLIENSPHLGFSFDDFEPDWDHCSATRVEFEFVGELNRPCPDCVGTGQYVGFNVVEPCRAYDGTGWLP